MRYDLPNYLSVIAVLATQDFAATANGTPVDLSTYLGKVLFRIDAGNASAGTTPNLTFVVKESTDNGNWTNANNASITAIIASAAQTLAYDTRAHGRYVRFDGTLTGTNSPSFPVGIVGLAQKEYNPA